MTQRILVIDDETDFTHFLKKNLEATGQYEVLVCNDATKAVQEAKAQRPVVILLDLMMPDMPGEEVVTALKEQKDTASIPVVFLTALVRPNEAAQASNMIGGHRFLAKPVKINELTAMLRAVTGAKS
jgi:DNA-binding response OmpR family regulator